MDITSAEIYDSLMVEFSHEHKLKTSVMLLVMF